MAGPLAVVAWAGALAAVVVVAVAGSLASRPTEREPVPSTIPALVAPSLATPVRLALPPTEPVLRIVEPVGNGTIITSTDLVLRGTRAGPAGPTQVTLLSGDTPVARETLPASGGGGAFRLELPVPGPRPGDPLVLEVVAFTTAVRPAQVVRIPVRVGPIRGGAPRAVGRTGEGPIGEDGILGGIVFGNAWDPEAMGTPAP